MKTNDSEYFQERVVQKLTGEVWNQQFPPNLDIFFECDSLLEQLLPSHVLPSFPGTARWLCDLQERSSDSNKIHGTTGIVCLWPLSLHRLYAWVGLVLDFKVLLCYFEIVNTFLSEES
jgi:hypothetical protein